MFVEIIFLLLLSSYIQAKRDMKRILITAFLVFPNALIGDSLSISGNPSTLTISTVTAGSNPNSVSDSSTTYNSITTNTVRNITGKINSAMPTGVTLNVQLAAPVGASSAGSLAMGTTAVNLVSSIPKNTTSTNLTITYTLSATAAASPSASSTRTLTLTLQ